MPLDRAAVLEMHPPDRTALFGIGDAAGDGADAQRAATEAPGAVLGRAHLLQLHPVARPVRRDAGDLLSPIKRRLLACYLLPPLRIEDDRRSGDRQQSDKDRTHVACRLTACNLTDPPPTGPEPCLSTPRNHGSGCAQSHWNSTSPATEGGAKSARTAGTGPDPAGHSPPHPARLGLPDRERFPTPKGGWMGALGCGSRACASPFSSPWNR